MNDRTTESIDDEIQRLTVDFTPDEIAQVREAALADAFRLADAIRAARVPVLPCPAWCEQSAAHPFSVVADDEGAVFRVHVARQSAIVTIEAEERYLGGTTTLGAPHIGVAAAIADGDLTPERAYDLGDDLNTAARRVEQIISGGGA